MATTVTSQIQGITISESVKAPVHAVSTGNLTLSGLQTVGGVVLNGTTLKRVLAKDQIDLTENGIYDAGSSAWTRSKDFDGNRDVVQGTIVLTSNNSDLVYRVTTANPIIIGTSSIVFELSSLDLTQSEFNALLALSDPYKRTAAEIAAGVTPTSYAIVSHDATGIFDIKRYGAVEGADNTTAFQRANLVALQAGGGTIALTCNSLLTTGIVFTAANTTIDGYGHYCQFAPGFVKHAGPGNWDPYNVMLVANADNVWFRHIRFLGGIITATSNYFAGSFTWFAQGVLNGGVDECYYENLRYDPATNSVAIQTSSTSQNIKISRCKFLNCTGAVSLQGLYSTVADCTAEKTNAAAGTPLTAVPGATDQPFGTDGSTGCSIINCKVINSALVPPAGALIGANVGATDFTISKNTILGFTGGVALYIRSSSNGVVNGNIIDGLGTTSIGNWAYLRVDADCSNVDVTDNILRRALVAGVGTGTGLSVYTGGNTCRGNKVLFGSVSAAALEIGKGTTPAESVYEQNYLQTGGIGTLLAVSDNILASTGIEVPIIHRHNTFATPITTPYSCPGVSRQIKFYIENDRIVSTAYNAAAQVPPLKFIRPFRNGFMHRFPFKVDFNSVFYSNELPTSPNYDLTTWEWGDTINQSQPATAATPGWICTIAGTFPNSAGAYSQAGTAASGSPTITGLANTTGVLVGDYVSPSARWATTGPYKVIALTSTTLTLDTNANASGAATITHFTPIFKLRGVLS